MAKWASRDSGSLNFSQRAAGFSINRADAASATTCDVGGNANHRLDTRVHIGRRDVRRPTSSADSPQLGRRSIVCATRHLSQKEDWRLRLPHLRCRR